MLCFRINSLLLVLCLSCGGTSQAQANNRPASLAVQLALASTLQASASSSSAQVQQHKEFVAVDQTMKTMMQAFQAGRADIVFQVMNKDAVVLGYSAPQQKILIQTGEEWAKGFPGKPADDEHQRHRQYTILDISDTGAVVKVMLDYPKWLGVDYLALSKIEGQWKIVSKSWSGVRK